MSADTLFSVCSFIVLPGWILLIFLPRWSWTTKLISSVVIPLLLALVYLKLAITDFAVAEGGFGSLSEIAKLFENKNLLLAGWIHYLAFDLFVGSWEVRDAQKLQITHYLVIPCLFLTFMFGPIGYLLYFIIRLTVKKKLLIEPD